MSRIHRRASHSPMKDSPWKTERSWCECMKCSSYKWGDELQKDMFVVELHCGERGTELWSQQMASDRDVSRYQPSIQGAKPCSWKNDRRIDCNAIPWEFIRNVESLYYPCCGRIPSYQHGQVTRVHIKVCETLGRLTGLRPSYIRSVEIMYSLFGCHMAATILLDPFQKLGTATQSLELEQNPKQNL